MEPSLCYVTLSVGNLKEAEAFYREVLGFNRSIYYEPTQWVAFDMTSGAAGFAIIEAAQDYKAPEKSMVDIFVEGIEAYWTTIKDQVKVVSELQHTPWGSYKFVIQDPYGNNIGFVERGEP